MDALELLLHRNSAPKLRDPGPDDVALATMFEAAARAPDHARLRPWRFLVIRGPARERLGEVFAEATLAANPQAGEKELEKVRGKALRAPLIVVVIATISEHPKVPPIEQRLSAGAAAHAIVLAAEVLGFAGIWRTGSMAYDSLVAGELGLAQNEELIGYLYLGTREGDPKPLPDYDPDERVEFWEG